MSESNVTGGAQKVVGGIVAALVGVPLLVYLVVKLATSGSGVDLGTSTMSAEAISARMQPVGAVKIVDATAPGARTGKQVYEAICISCHGAGLAGAPKFGDAGAWSSRIAQGFDTLVKHAIGGFNAMPAKGGAADLTDEEVTRAVAFMGNSAGGSFEEPKVVAAAGAAIDPAVKGKEIYDGVCMACHASGLAGAPKFGDKAAWSARLKEGDAAAIAIGIKGLNAMPPKGGYSGSDEEFAAAAQYMINASK
ncbi:c-type cytochrome [Chitinibacteraceae bacterium HSL-7]